MIKSVQSYSFAFACLTVVGACVDDRTAELGADLTGDEDSARIEETASPDFRGAPNISGAIAGLGFPLGVGAVMKTNSGFQIYRCDVSATGFAWALRTPLTALEPQTRVRGAWRRAFRDLVAGLHYRSDFGGLLSVSRRQPLGLISADGSSVNAPVWDFTFQPSGAASRHEIVAGRLLVQDDGGPGNIPRLLLEVRGNAIDEGYRSPIANATHLVRWNTRGGRSPDPATCNAETLGQESQAPYSADYYFLVPSI